MNAVLKYLKSDICTEQCGLFVHEYLTTYVPLNAYLMVSSMFVQKTDDWFNMSFLNNV